MKGGLSCKDDARIAGCSRVEAVGIPVSQAGEFWPLIGKSPSRAA